MSKALRTLNSSRIIAQYCDLSTEFHPEEIIYDNPLFINPDSGDFHLQIGSPCINAGILDKGTHNIFWNGENDYGKLVASGIYICLLKVDDYENLIRIVFIK